jgi:hypothetical protein
VLIDNNGRFIMNGGTIGGENPADGNTVLINNIYVFRLYIAGGVLVDQGLFDMYGGTIQSNNTIVFHSGSSGVYVNRNGVFTMNGAETVIKGNIIHSTIIEGSLSMDDNAGGVYNSGTFTMNNGIIRENTSYGLQSTGGVFNSGTFTMNNGTINGNRSLGSGIDADPDPNSGGGIFNFGTFTMNNGIIGGENPEDANIAVIGANGIYNRSTIIMSGGVITGNTAGGSNNYGVYVRFNYYTYKFTMTGTAMITPDNMVFLTSTANITIDGNLSVSPAANIIHESPIAGTTYLLQANSSSLIADNYNKFLYNGEAGHINGTPTQVGNTLYGVYQ